MRAFNLQEALAGKPVVTRDGKSVQSLHHFKDAVKCIYPLTAVIDGQKREYTPEGNYDLGRSESSWDLFMEPEYVWANLYCDDNYEVRGYVYETEEAANKAAASKRIACVKIPRI